MHPLVDRYLRLGLTLGRHVDGLVDGYHGPPEPRAAVEANEPPPPPALLDEARVLREEVERADLDEPRRRWLAAQLDGLACVAELESGAEISWREAVRRCYGLEVDVTTEDRFEAAHAALDEALPGSGELGDRLERWRESQTVPTDRLLPAFHALIEELRERTRELVALPDGERFEAELVSGQPWGAYNWYLGNLRSRIQINTDLPVQSYFVAMLAAHEGYPGHHTEGACKETRLVRERGCDEQALLLIHTPACVVSEGIATIAVEQALGADWPRRAAEVLRPHGVPFDADVAQVVVDSAPVLGRVGVNVACFSSERGWSEDEAVRYHMQWALSAEERAVKAVAFARHPMWSVYVPTYTYGYRLARAYAERRADGFAALLTEQLTTADLLEARGDGEPQ